MADLSVAANAANPIEAFPAPIVAYQSTEDYLARKGAAVNGR